MTAKAPKKFYQSANVEPLDGEYTIVLDGRPVRTPMKTKLSVPSERLAAAIALEWDTQKDVIDLNSMPMTGFASATLD
ncbi:MAG: ATP12 family chaperone protein, partial [Rickettsiales bacterium]